MRVQAERSIRYGKLAVDNAVHTVFVISTFKPSIRRFSINIETEDAILVVIFVLKNSYKGTNLAVVAS